MLHLSCAFAFVRKGSTHVTQRQRSRQLQNLVEHDFFHPIITYVAADGLQRRVRKIVVRSLLFSFSVCSCQKSNLVDFCFIFLHDFPSISCECDNVLTEENCFLSPTCYNRCQFFHGSKSVLKLRTNLMSFVFTIWSVCSIVFRLSVL